MSLEGGVGEERDGLAQILGAQLFLQRELVVGDVEVRVRGNVVACLQRNLAHHHPYNILDVYLSREHCVVNVQHVAREIRLFFPLRTGLVQNMNRGFGTFYSYILILAELITDSAPDPSADPNCRHNWHFIKMHLKTKTVSVHVPYLCFKGPPLKEYV